MGAFLGVLVGDTLKGKGPREARSPRLSPPPLRAISREPPRVDAMSFGALTGGGGRGEGSKERGGLIDGETNQ